LTDPLPAVRKTERRRIGDVLQAMPSRLMRLAKRGRHSE
jgi:hypothetical protein